MPRRRRSGVAVEPCQHDYKWSALIAIPSASVDCRAVRSAPQQCAINKPSPQAFAHVLPQNAVTTFCLSQALFDCRACRRIELVEILAPSLVEGLERDSHEFVGSVHAGLPHLFFDEPLSFGAQ